MACGKSAEQIYKLIEDIGPDSPGTIELVFNNLVKWLSGDEIEKFVDSFRRDYDMEESLSIVQTHFDPEVDSPTEDMEMEENPYDLCMTCQNTYHGDEDHSCDNDYK